MGVATKRLLQIIGSVDPASGGPLEGLVQQDSYLKRNGFEPCDVASLDAPQAPFVAASPLRVIALGSERGGHHGWSRPLSRYGVSPRMIPWLRQHVRDYDAVIVNGLWNYSTFAAARVLPTAGVSYFVYSHGMMDPWFRRQNVVKHLAKQASWLICEGKLMARAEAVLFTTEEERVLAKGEFLGWSYKEAVVGYGTTAPPPADAAQAAAFAAQFPALRGRRFLLFLSRIHPKKGCDLLIEAFAGLASSAPDLDLVIAGPDQVGIAGNLRARATALGIGPRVHWPGMLTGAAKWGAYRACDGFVLPSHQENFGVVVAEALACGKPVLITDKVNIWREVADAGAGLVEADTPAGIARLLRRYLALDEAGRQSLAAAAKPCFEQAFSVEISCRNIIALIDRVMCPAP